ncbi:armadillo-type protein [Chytridium lagenaria]|nr:armadillo-type protein [Chytridium lagenaria]
MDSLDGIQEKINAADSPEKKEQIVFQWLYLLEKNLSSCTEKDLIDAQAKIEKVLFQLLTSVSPKPTRPVRQTIGRILSLVYQQGETRSLFDFIANLHSHYANKKLDDPQIKIALVHCVGSLSENVGEKVLSLYPESTAMFLKGLKLTRDTDLGLRYEAIRALSQSLSVGGKTLSEATVKEILKLSKAGLSDKNSAIRSGYSKLLQSLYKYCNVARPLKVDELETTIGTFVKSVETSNFALRKDIAGLIGTLAVLCLQSGSKPANANDKKAQTVFNLEDVLGALGNCIMKHFSRDIRETLFLSYIETVRGLGISVLESNYLTIVRHLALWVKGFCNHISREILKMIAENSQVIALKDLSAAYLPIDVKDGNIGADVPLNDLQLIFVLEEISYILDVVGTAALPAFSAIESLPFNDLTLHLPRSSQNLPKERRRGISQVYNIGAALAAVVGVVPKHALNVSFDLGQRVGWLNSFLTFNAKDLLSVDVAKRVVVYLNNVLAFITMIPLPAQSQSMAFKHKMVSAEYSLRTRLFKCFHKMKPLSSFETSFELLVKLSLETFLPDTEGTDRATIASGDKQIPSFEFSLFSSVNIHYLAADEDNSILKSCDGLVNSSEFVVPHCVQHLNTFAPHQFDIDLTHFNSEYLRPTSVIAVDNAIDFVANEKAALQRNLLVSLRGALKVFATRKITISDDSLVNGIKNVTEEFVVTMDPSLRLFASDVLGRLCRSISSGPFINTLIQAFVDRIINIRDPDQRSGCSLALGFINSYVGGMASSSHLKTIVGILHSLSSDPHALVHTWALQSLSMVVESASVMYGSFTNSTLSLVVKLFMSESHDYHISGQTSNSLTLNTAVIFGRLLYGLIGVVGPELQASSESQGVVLWSLQELRNDSDPAVVIEAVRCIKQLRNHGSNHAHLRKAAITCIYQMTQKDPELVLNVSSGKQLEEQLFTLLDVEAEDMVRNETKDVIMGLLKHVVVEAPSKWINICKSIAAKGGMSTSNLNLNIDVQDTRKTTTTMIQPWRNRKILQILSSANIAQHVDLIAARGSLGDGKPHDYLVFRLTDLIKIAFSCATATVYDLRMEGLSLLSDILEVFFRSQRPGFQESALLEQYQAQISAALTPAFNEDVLPIIQALACRVCAAYVGSGINTDNFQKVTIQSIVYFCSNRFLTEFVKRSSPNEIAMLRISALAAWSQLTLSASKYPYLSTIVGPNLSRLVKSWFELLRDYAHLKADLDSISPLSLLHTKDSSSQNSNMYMAATRDVILPYYKECWHFIIESLSSLVDTNIALLVNVLDSHSQSSQISILIGLCIESASHIGLGFDQGKVSIDSKEQQAKISLQCLRKLLRPEILPAASFLVICPELIVVLEKIIQASDNQIQMEAIYILKSIITHYGDHILERDAAKKKQSESSETTAAKEIWKDSAFFGVWKVLMNSFIYHIPSLSLNPVTTFYLLKSPEQDRSRITVALLDALNALIRLQRLEDHHFFIIIPQALFILIEVMEENAASPEISNVALLSLRSIVDRCSGLAADVAARKLCKPFQSFIVSLLDKLQGYIDEKDTSVQQIKNIAVSISVCFSTPSALVQNREIIVRASSMFSDLLNLGDQFSEIAVSCVRVLFLQLDFAKMTPTHTVFLRELVPQLFTFIVHGKDTISIEIYQELLKIFSSLAMTLPKEFMVVMLRSLSALPSQDTDSQKDRVLAATLLQTAAKRQTEFRGALMELSAEDKGAIERSLKSLVAGNTETTAVKKEADAETLAPKIKLKTFF